MSTAGQTEAISAFTEAISEALVIHGVTLVMPMIVTVASGTDEVPYADYKVTRVSIATEDDPDDWYLDIKEV